MTSFDVGGGPVGIAVRPDGKQVWVALANRFANTEYNPKGREVVGLLGTDETTTEHITAWSEPAFAFPRELVFPPDDRMFAVGLFELTMRRSEVVGCGRRKRARRADR